MFEFYRNLKQKYANKNPREKWNSVRWFNIFLLKFIGSQVMDMNFKVHFKTLIPGYLALNYFGLLIYTLYYYRHEPFRALQATPTTGQIVPALVLYALVLNPSTREQYQRMYMFAGDYIYSNSKLTPKNQRVCEEMSDYLITGSFKILMILNIAIVLAVIAPLTKLGSDKEKEMIIPVILPFIDPDTEKGFYINLANQLVTCVYGVVILPGTELITCVLKNTVTATAAVIDNALHEFDCLLEESSEFSMERNWHFRNLIVRVLDFDRFVLDLTDLYYWKFLLQPGLLIYSVAMSIFLYKMTDWTTGIGCAACCYLQLLILCDVGKTVDDANIVILEALNRTTFYLLPTKKQKMLALIIGRIQNGAKIRMGPLQELNYESATGFTKMIYTYLMVILQLVE